MTNPKKIHTAAPLVVANSSSSRRTIDMEMIKVFEEGFGPIVVRYFLDYDYITPIKENFIIIRHDNGVDSRRLIERKVAEFNYREIELVSFFPKTLYDRPYMQFNQVKAILEEEGLIGETTQNILLVTHITDVIHAERRVLSHVLSYLKYLIQLRMVILCLTKAEEKFLRDKDSTLLDLSLIAFAVRSR